MKRIRLSTLLLLVVIAALGIALVARERSHSRELAEVRRRIEELQRSRLGDFVWGKEPERSQWSDAAAMPGLAP